MPATRIIVLIADGLGDRPIPALSHCTPLQKANTPALDAIAKNGICGTMDLLAPGIPVGTDMGHLILFGGKEEEYPGRGPVEACGIHMAIEPGDVIFRCNFATMNADGNIIDRRAGRINNGTKELAASLHGMQLEGGIQAFVEPATAHRAVLVLRGQGLSDSITDTDPKNSTKHLPPLQPHPLDDTAAAKRTAKALAEFLQRSSKLLAAHPINQTREQEKLLPANCLLTRGAGKFTGLASTPACFGIQAACIAAEATVLGMATLKGIKPLTNPALTGEADTDIEEKARMTLQALKDNNLVYVHVKAPDLAGHDNDPKAKISAIEKVDALAAHLLAGMPDSTLIALAADHSTPCVLKEHSGDPVPIAIYGPGVRKDNVHQFDEIACATGGLGRMRGIDFFNTLIDLIGVSHKKGN